MTEHNTQQPERISRYKGKTSTSVVLSDEQLQQLDTLAAKMMIGRSALLRIIISEWLESRSN